MSFWVLYGICKVFLSPLSHITAITHTYSSLSFNIVEGASYNERDS